MHVYPPGQSPVVSASIVITINDDSSYTHNGSELALAEVESVVEVAREEYGSLSDVYFVLQASEGASDASLVDLMSELERAGIVKLTLMPAP